MISEIKYRENEVKEGTKKFPEKKPCSECQRPVHVVLLYRGQKETYWGYDNHDSPIQQIAGQRMLCLGIGREYKK